MPADILIFAEDPGAANYVAALPDALRIRGWTVKLLAEGYAKDYLSRRGVGVEVVEEGLQASDLLRREHPRLLIVGTSENLDTLGLKLCLEARVMGIRSLGVVDALGNAPYRFRGQSDDSLFYAPDWLAVPDSWTREAYASLGYPVERVMICGHPQYDHILEVGAGIAGEGRKGVRKRLFPSMGGELPLVVFAAEISAGIRPQQYYELSDDYTLSGRGKSVGRTEIVLEEFLDALAAAACHAYRVLRLHPKNDPDEFKRYAEEFDYVSQNEPPYHLIYAADLVVGMSSILLFEAALMGTPTLSVLPRTTEKESVIGVLAGITPCVTTREQLISILPGLLSGETHPPRLGSDVVVKGSTGRVVDLVEELLVPDSDSRFILND